MRPEPLRKLPTMLSSTCASSDVEAVTQDVDKALQLHRERSDRLEAARQVLIDQSRALVERHLGILPRSKPLKELTTLVYRRSQRADTRLGHGAKREPEAIARFWATDRRGCTRWRFLEQTPGDQAHGE